MTRSIEYYLSKGFDIRMAEYFANGRRRIVNVEPNDDYTLTLTFDNGEIRYYDVKPIIQEETVFSFLSVLENFKRVYLDTDHVVSWDIDPNIDSDIVWNNKVDLCSDTCYVDSIAVK